VLDTPRVAPANALPVGHTIFDGITVVQCDMREQDVLRVLRDAVGLREALGDAVRKIIDRTVENPSQRATWQRCRPQPGGHSTTLNDAIRGKVSAAFPKALYGSSIAS
jgi:hypothetical protein